MTLHLLRLQSLIRMNLVHLVGDTKYKGMIGSLLYLTASRPYIVFSGGLCARFQSCPKESHIMAVKRIFRYFIGTLNLVLWYSTGNSFDLFGFADADYAGYLIDRKSTFRMAHFLEPCMVSWAKKNKTLSLCLLLKLSTLLQHHVVLSFYGLNNKSYTSASKSNA